LLFPTDEHFISIKIASTSSGVRGAHFHVHKTIPQIRKGVPQLLAIHLECTIQI